MADREGIITQKHVSELAWSMQNKGVARKTVPSGRRKEPTYKGRFSDLHTHYGSCASECLQTKLDAAKGVFNFLYHKVAISPS